ncbi:MAG: hypothetical protein QW597_06440 [Thermoplasmataceae archaeon]
MKVAVFSVMFREYYDLGLWACNQPLEGNAGIAVYKEIYRVRLTLWNVLKKPSTRLLEKLGFTLGEPPATRHVQERIFRSAILRPTGEGV